MSALVGALLAFSGISSSGHAGTTLPDLSACEPLAACISRLDSVIPVKDNGAEPSGADVAASQLERFGDPAKAALLQHAMSSRPGWRNYAGAILAYWPNWSVEDVPALSAALERDHGGWIAKALKTIGEDSAINALVADLPDAGAESQTGWALIELAPQSFPKLLVLLEGDLQSPAGAAAFDVISKASDHAKLFASSWAAIALDTTQPQARRIAALRALLASAAVAVDEGELLRPLLINADTRIASAAKETLLALGDPSVAADAVEACAPTKGQSSHPELSGDPCILDFLTFRRSQDVVGPRLVEFANSNSGPDAALAIGVIGQLGYRPAGRQLLGALGSQDWRVSIAAAATLGVLGTSEARSTLEKVSQEHWLPELRQQALKSLVAINSGAYLAPQTREQLVNSQFSEFVGDSQPKACRKWEWRGAEIKQPTRITKEIQFGSGRISALDRGEWGGGLFWSQSPAHPQVLLDDNIRALLPVKDGVLALAGLSHLWSNYGYVVHVRQTPSGWDIKEIARLPGYFSAISAIGDDTYAAWRTGRVVVFSDHGILGLADCQV